MLGVYRARLKHIINKFKVTKTLKVLTDNKSFLDGKLNQTALPDMTKWLVTMVTHGLTSNKRSKSGSKMPILAFLFFFFTSGKGGLLIENFEPEKCNSTFNFDPVSRTCKTSKCENDSVSLFNDKLKVYECVKCDESLRSILCSLKSLVCDKYDYKGNLLLY